MYRYLTITPSIETEAAVETLALVAFLKADPDLIQTNPVGFAAANGKPWLNITLAKRHPSGGLASTGALIPFFDIVEMVCSEDGSPLWHEALARRIATFLGWIVKEEADGRQIWPIPDHAVAVPTET